MTTVSLRRLVLMLPVVAFIGLVVTIIVVWQADRAGSSTDDRRGAALAAARQQAVNLTTIDYRTATHDLERIVNGSTGEARRLAAQQMHSFPAVLRAEHSVSSGVVASAGLSAYAGDRATAAVAVDATVSSRSPQLGPTEVVKHFRMSLHLARVGGHWLVSSVDFLGVPT